MSFWNYFTNILQGMPTTLEMMAISVVAVIVLATVLAVGRVSGGRLVKILVAGYVELFRGVPQLALLFLIFFGLPAATRALSFPAFWCAVAALVLSEAAYTSEIYRSALESVSHGQWEAAASLGMGRLKAFRYVIIPQAVIPAIPPTLNMSTYIMKGTALASMITVNEMFLHASTLVSLYAQPLTTYLALMVAYVIITVPLGYAARVLGSLTSRRLAGATRL